MFAGNAINAECTLIKLHSSNSPQSYPQLGTTSAGWWDTRCWRNRASLASPSVAVAHILALSCQPCDPARRSVARHGFGVSRVEGLAIAGDQIHLVHAVPRWDGVIGVGLHHANFGPARRAPIPEVHATQLTVRRRRRDGTRETTEHQGAELPDADAKGNGQNDSNDRADHGFDGTPATTFAAPAPHDPLTTTPPTTTPRTTTAPTTDRTNHGRAATHRAPARGIDESHEQSWIRSTCAR